MLQMQMILVMVIKSWRTDVPVEDDDAVDGKAAAQVPLRPLAGGVGDVVEQAAA